LGMTMNGKKQLLTMLKEEFNRWEELPIGMSEEQITAPQLPSNRFIKAVVFDRTCIINRWRRRLG
jgi:hypothetical protein